MSSSVRHPADVLIGEAASLFYLLGGMATKHLVIVGGLVPPLLVLQSAEPHIGSGDIDVCLSLAVTAGETREYYRSIEEILSPHFELVRASGFRWRKKPGAHGIPLLLDFLAPSADEDTQLADGTRALDAETAARNAGGQLRPFAIRAGDLIEQDAISRKLEGVDLVYHPGVRSDVTIRFAGPVGFLAAKADALAGRSEFKDGYDVAWWALNAAETAADVAALVLGRASFTHDLFPESVAELQHAFKERDYPGPSGYAKEKHPNQDPGDEDYETARNEAYLVMSELIAILKDRLWA